MIRALETLHALGALGADAKVVEQERTVLFQFNSVLMIWHHPPIHS